LVSSDAEPDYFGKKVHIPDASPRRDLKNIPFLGIILNI
jgi:hypothetical protein